MANKRSQRGQYFGVLGPDLKDEQNFDRAWNARQWDQARIRRFVKAQFLKREWINFIEIADWCSKLGGSGVPNEAAREEAFRTLESDLLEGKFEEAGRSQVLFLHPRVTLTHGKMTPEWLEEARDKNYDNEYGRSYLRRCWLPQKLFQRWCGWYHLPKSPPRFEPQESHPVLAPTAKDETAAIKALAPHLVAMKRGSISAAALFKIGSGQRHDRGQVWRQRPRPGANGRNRRTEIVAPIFSWRLFQHLMHVIQRSV
jgi:hypothetical protein